MRDDSNVLGCNLEAMGNRFLVYLQGQPTGFASDLDTGYVREGGQR